MRFPVDSNLGRWDVSCTVLELVMYRKKETSLFDTSHLFDAPGQDELIRIFAVWLCIVL